MLQQLPALEGAPLLEQRPLQMDLMGVVPVFIQDVAVVQMHCVSERFLCLVQHIRSLHCTNFQ